MKTRRIPTEEQKAAAKAKRSQLCTMTAPFRAYVERNNEVFAAMLGGWTREECDEYLAKHGVPVRYRFCATLNACLQADYIAETGQREWHTFHGWKEQGFSVDKGQKGFMIWSTPKPMKKTVEFENVETGATDSEERTSHRFAIAYLFHAGQVSNEQGERPASYNASAQPETVEAVETVTTAAAPVLALPAPREQDTAPEVCDIIATARAVWVQAPQRDGWTETEERTKTGAIIWQRRDDFATYHVDSDSMKPLNIWDVEKPRAGQQLLICPPPAPARFKPAVIATEQEEFDLCVA